MAENKVLVELQLVQKGDKISLVQKESEKLARSTDKVDRAQTRASKSGDKYNRVAKGAAGISSNSTKNFSKMQQSIDGGSNSLVRAYALLAANVFALSAAFGVLSRAAQIDTLTKSIERLEVVSGKSVRAVARDLQQASGFSLDFANSLRSTSLALSAGFDASQIAQLGEVAKNAAVSLGRPLADSLDRIFRGVIKVEPELLDEIGLFVRVDEAAQKYADELGIASSELTEFQKRTAFANEAIDQGTKKFAAFSDIDPDAFAILGATFADVAQSALAFLNKGLIPIINFFQQNQALLIGAFAGIGVTILKSVIPAMGIFRQSARQAAQEAREQFSNFRKDLEATAKVQKENAVQAAKLTRDAATQDLKAAEAARKKIPAYTQGGKALEEANKALEKASTKEERLAALQQKRLAFNKSIKESNREVILEQQAALQAEEDALEAVILRERELKNIRQRRTVIEPQKGSFMDLEGIRLAKAELRSLALENVATTASTEGLRAAFQRLKVEEQVLAANTVALGGTFGLLDKLMFKTSATVTILSIKMSELMLKFAPFFPILTIVALLFPAITKAMGFGSEAAKKYGDAQDATNELLDIFPDKLRTAREAMMTTENGFKAMTDASLAFKRALSEIGKTLEDEQAAYIEYLANTNGFVQFFTNFLDAGARDLAEKQAQAVGEILANFDGASIEVQDIIRNQVPQETIDSISNFTKEIDIARKAQRELLIEQTTILNKASAMDAGVERDKLFEDYRKVKSTFDETGESIEKLREKQEKLIKESTANLGGIGLKEITELSTKQGDALENAKSGIAGALDSAREFKKQFITKSDVDKPLSSFRQITAALAETNKKSEATNLSISDRKILLNEIAAGENAVLDIMTKEARERFKAETQDQKRLDIIEEQEQEYAKAKVTLTATKTLLSEIASQQKMIANLAKESAAGVERKFELEKESLNANIALLEANLKNNLIVANLTKEEVEQLSLKKVNKELLEEIVALGGKENEGLTAVLAQRTLNIELIKQEIAEKTETFRKDIELNNILKSRINAQEKLNASQNKGVELAAKQAAFLGRGTTELTPAKTFELSVKVEEQRLKLAKEKAKIEKAIIKAQFDILRTELKILNEKNPIDGYAEAIKALNDAQGTLIKTIDQDLKNSAASFLTDVFSQIGGVVTSSFTGGSTQFSIKDQTAYLNTIAKSAEQSKYFSNETKKLNKEIEDLSKNPVLASGNEDIIFEKLQKLDNIKTAQSILNIKLLQETLFNFAATVQQNFGEEGVVIASLANLSATLASFGTQKENLQEFGAVFKQVIEGDFSGALDTLKTGGNEVAAVLSTIAASIGALGQLVGAVAQQEISAIDKLIDAEKRADGKSAESVAKMQVLEQKKEKIAKKAFDMQKKLMMAQAIMNTAAGVTSALVLMGIPGMQAYATALIVMISAIGAAQLALISKLNYQGGGSSMESPSTALSIGKQSNAVDVSQQATGGELNYLRGGRTTGGDLGGAGAYLPGGAMGRRGYANGGEGILVGERGPEIVSPSMPVDITPNYALGGQPTNVNFNINAVDAAGVEDVLMNQRGNIIRMIREAANENGERFLETIDTQSYGSRT